MRVDNKGKYWKTAEEYVFGEYTIEEGFESDGSSIPTVFMRFFTHTDLIKMFVGSVKHDWFCKNRQLIGRKAATELLVADFKDAGVGDKWYTAWKLVLIYYSVEIYQFFKGWR